MQILAEERNRAVKVFDPKTEKVIKDFFSGKDIHLRLMHDDYGEWAELEVEGSEKNLLPQWVELIKRLKEEGLLTRPIFLKVNGILDAKPEEVGKYWGKAMALMGCFLKGKPFDGVEVLRNLRNE